MNRRKFIAKASVASAGLACGTLASPAIAQGKVEWRMVTAWPKNLPGLGTGAERLAQKITQMS
jgi:TRAP-type mannitol/chloroaromatic compound transport system substrate-binding protein